MPSRLFTNAQLARIVGCSPERAAHWGGHLRSAMHRYGITRGRRVAHCLAQLGHESASFSRTVENLNYTAQRLREVFPRYFSAQLATDYARQPQRIANRVYANRMGNRNEASGDGWRYRGRGLIQLTGANNYRRIGQMLDMPLLHEPDRLLQPDVAALASAAWWWDAGLNALADTGDILMVSRRINLGSATSRATPHGMPDRIRRTRLAMDVLGVS